MKAEITNNDIAINAIMFFILMGLNKKRESYNPL